MSKYKAVVIPIYNGFCQFYSGNEEACAAHFAKNHNGPKELFETGRPGACVVQDGSTTAAIYVKRHADYSAIAHEIFHATKHIMKDVGIVLSDESEEAFACLVSFLMKEWLSSKKWTEIG